jgi:hypothetical protein
MGYKRRDVSIKFKMFGAKNLETIDLLRRQSSRRQRFLPGEVLRLYVALTYKDSVD